MRGTCVTLVGTPHQRRHMCIITCHNINVLCAHALQLTAPKHKKYRCVRNDTFECIEASQVRYAKN
jgi:hypothetical protein